MRVIVAAVGKPRDAGLAAAIREYETRAARYWPLEVVEVKEEPARGGVTPDQVRAREAERMAERLPAGAHVVACEIDGQRMSSEQFSAWLQGERERGRDVAFAIGGAFGLGDAVRERARTRLSVAPWTLPHELARLVLSEQLYRAGSIQRGEPYHK